MVTHRKIERVKWLFGRFGLPNKYVDEYYINKTILIPTWSGKIALMYSNDYGYSSDLKVCKSQLSNYSNFECKSTNWMYDSSKNQWTLHYSTYYASSVFSVNLDGQLDDYIHASSHSTHVNAVRPTMYLKSDVGIVEEKETSEGLKYLVVE